MTPAPAPACAHCGLPLRPSRGPAPPELPRYCCYGCVLAAQVAGRDGEEGQARWILARLMLAGFLAMNVMLLSFTLYSTDVYALEVTSRMQAFIYATCRWIMLGCSLGVLLLLGVPVARNAVTELRAGRLTADLFILVGVAGAWTVSVVHTLAGGGGVYFDTAAMLLVLLTVGRLLEARGRAASGAAVADLLAATPETAHRLSADGEVELPQADIQVGDRLAVRPGEGIPADGRIEEGASDLDESTLTGEARPVAKGSGAEVFAGTVNLTGRLVIRATAVGGDRALARLTRLLETARRERAPVQRLADRVAAVLLPITLTLAVGVCAWWWARGQLEVGILNALAVLVVACPCALGVATPLALWIALCTAARRGAVVRTTGVLEVLGRVDTLLFDKTGTLTEGIDAGCDVYAAPGYTEATALATAAAAASGSNHPVSLGISAEARHRGLTWVTCGQVLEFPGHGLRGELSPGGSVMVGSRAWVLGETGMSAWEEAPASDEIDAWIALDGHLCGAVRTRERIRPEAGEALRELRKMGMRLELLTGDRAARAQIVADACDLTVQAELRPEDKLAYVRAEQGRGHCVGMVGDGLNDAAALAAADVGIAMGCGADLTRDAAHVCMRGNRLDDVAWLLRYARRARRTVRGNLLWAVLYNAVGLPLAAVGWLTPVFAALLMVGSSVLVLANSLRLRSMPDSGGGTGTWPPAVGAGSPGPTGPGRPESVTA